jgi:hypothetical protein
MSELRLYHRKQPEPASEAYSWNEEAEILFVLEEEKKHEGIYVHNVSPVRRMHLRLPSKQVRRARHIPGPMHIPAIIIEW